MRWLLSIAAGASVVTANTLTLACSEVLPPEGPPPCTTLTTYTPGAQFPLDLATSGIRVSLWRKSNGLQSALDGGFPLTPPLQLFRATTAGFEPAPFALETGEGLVSNARTLRLLDPQPGRYHVAWDGDSCIAQASPAGSGKDVGGFTLTPSVALPATLGTVTAAAPVTRGRDLKEGVGGDCRPVMVHLDEAEVILTLAPATDLLPWADAITTGLEVDGKVAIGFAKPDPVALAEGRMTIDVRRICASDKPRYLENPGIAEGRHTGRVLGKIEGRPDIASAPVEFELRCDAPRATASDDAARPGGMTGTNASDGGGCNAGARVPEGGTLALAALGAILARRSRRRFT